MLTLRFYRPFDPFAAGLATSEIAEIKINNVCVAQHQFAYTQTKLPALSRYISEDPICLAELRKIERYIHRERE
jgi:hypothetical protein